MIEPGQETLLSEQDEFHDIEDFIAAYQVAGKYRCSLHQWDDNVSEWAFLKSYKDRTPPPDEVAKHFGCGLARWTFIREDADPVTRQKQKSLEYKMLLKGEHFEGLHQEYKEEMDVTRLKKLREKMEKMRVENMYMGAATPGNGFEDSLKMMTAMKGVLGGGNDSGTATLMAIVKMMETSGASAMQASRDQMQMMMAMMTNQTQMTVGLLQAMMSKDNGQKGYDPMEMFKMTTGLTREILSLKNDSEPVAPDRLKDILDFAKEVFPAAFAMLARVPKPARPMVVKKFTQDSKEFSDLKNNPELLAEALNTWDKNYGPEKMDDLLKDAGLKRPESTFGNYKAYSQPTEPTADGGNEPAAAEDDADVNDQGAVGAEET